MGAPGSGKGTLSKMIAPKFNLKHISTGDLFRKEIASKSAQGQIIANAINKGNIAPSDILIDVMKKQLSKPANKDNMLLDGFGKTVDEIKELDNFYRIDKVIWLDVDYNTVLNRILSRRICPECGFITTTSETSNGLCPKDSQILVVREDDNAEVFKKRYEIFKELTLPIYDYFKAKGKVEKIDANKSIDKNYAEICKILTKTKQKLEENSKIY